LFQTHNLLTKCITPSWVYKPCVSQQFFPCVFKHFSYCSSKGN